MAFGAPDSSQFKPEEFENNLLLILPHKFLSGVNTTFGTKDAIDAEIVSLDGDKEGTRMPSARVFSLVLLGQLRSKVGTNDAVLGRLVKGIAKPGQKPPWTLADPTPDDVKDATKWEKANGELRQPSGGGDEDGEDWKMQHRNEAPPRVGAGARSYN